MLLEAGWIETTDFVTGSTSDACYLQIMTENPKTHGLCL